MKNPNISFKNTSLLFSILFLLFSCSKDSDLLYDYVLTDGKDGIQLEQFAFNDNYSSIPNSSTVLDVLANDNIDNAEEVKIIKTSNPVNGIVIINDNKTLTYIPANAPESTTTPATTTPATTTPATTTPATTTPATTTPATTTPATTTPATTTTTTTTTTTQTAPDTFTYTAQVTDNTGTTTTQQATVTINTDNIDAQTTINTIDNFVACSAGGGATYNPTSLADIENIANAGKTAVITNSFNCDNCTFASGQTIIPSGGVISGANINVNGACIMDNFSKLFTSSVIFSSPYQNSRLSPEAFGADGSDSVADDATIIAAINNSEYIIGKENATYIKNDETVFFSIIGTGLRTLDWNMNNSVVTTTSSANLSHGGDDNSSKKYLFEIRNAKVKITNGTFDGQNLASRAFYLRGTESIDFQNTTVTNYYAPPNAKARGMAFLVEAEDNYIGGQWINCIISNIGAASDGNFNNVPYGFAKGIYFTVATENAVHTLIKDSRFENIYGDDAEGFSNTHKYQYNYEHTTSGLTFEIDNNDFIGCQRRALKVNLSNCEITNNYIESAKNAGRDATLGNFQAAQIHTFPIHDDETMHDVNITGNTVKILGASTNAAFGINDAKDCLIENNTFEAAYIDIDRHITFGAGGGVQGGLYEGDLSNTVIFRNNTINNIYMRLVNTYVPVNGGIVFKNNVFNVDVDRDMGHWWGVFRFMASGDTKTYTFEDTTVNINQTNGSGTFLGAIMTFSANFKNVTLDNFNVNYTGTTLTASPFGRSGTTVGLEGNWDSTNTISNCTLTGASGTGAIDITGTDTSVVIQNSVGDGAMSITTN